MKDIIILFILFVMITSIVIYLVRAKKQGAKCIGCSHAKQCNHHCHSQDTGK